MGAIWLCRLSDKTLAKYEQLEREGNLNKRQRNALAGHRLLPIAVKAMRRNYLEEKAAREKE